MSEAQRLAKRVAMLRNCSRREAELIVEGGWVRVDGVVVEAPQHKVTDQVIEVDPKARAEPLPPVTLLLHKPAGVADDGVAASARALLSQAKHWRSDPARQRLLQKHLLQQVCATALESAASGLLVFSQDWPVRRKLLQDGALVEHELIVEVRGPVSPQQLAQLLRAPVVDGRAMLPAKVSITSQAADVTGLRFAVKGHYPGRIAHLCDSAGLAMLSMRRIRVGRIALAALPPGQWRFMQPFEKF